MTRTPGKTATTENPSMISSRPVQLSRKLRNRESLLGTVEIVSRSATSYSQHSRKCVAGSTETVSESRSSSLKPRNLHRRQGHLKVVPAADGVVVTQTTCNPMSLTSDLKTRGSF